MPIRFFLFAALLAAASASGRPNRLPAPVPRMVISDAAAEPVQLQQLSIRSEISGGMAETSVRMVFFNPNRRQLEGTLQFPLADGQQVTAFSLDVNGAMRPAVPVDKARGRMVFEAIERRQVDPGLLEVTQGNNFKLRVYPILPRASRTVELTYSEALVRRGAAWAYRLPLAYGEAGKLDLKLRVNDSAAQPASSGMGPQLQFAAVDNGFEASLSRERFPGSAPVELLTQAHPGPRVYRQAIGESTWFVAEVPVKAVQATRHAPRIVGLLWDSSGSGAARAAAAEIDELDAYFRALGNVEVRLTRLRDRAEAQQVFQVVGGEWGALRRELEATVYDGASALYDWKPQPQVNHYLLFSDGLSNYGGKQFPVLAAHQRLFALNSALVADNARLAALAEHNRGQLIAVNPSAPGTAARALLLEEARLEGITASGATDIEVDSHTVRNGMLRIAGRLLAPRGQLTLTLANAGRRTQLVVPVEANAPHHPHAGATWAQLRLRALEADPELHRAEIGRIGRRFSIPTRETSLIVLEQMDDYVRYEIEPPPSMMPEYQRLKLAMATRRAQERSGHLEYVVGRFEQRKAWWAAPVVPGSQAVLAQAATAGPPPPAPAPAPRAEPPAQRPPPQPRADQRHIARQQKMATVTVTGSAIRRETVESRSPVTVLSKGSAANDAGAAPEGSIGMQLKRWRPDAPYIERLNQAPTARVYQVYLDQRPDYANSSAFFLDAADILFARGQRDLALRVLSNLSEMDLESRAVLRILGYRLLQADAPQLAVPVFEQVLRIAQEEPQSWRDLGLALAASGRTQEAIDTMYEVVLRPWDGRFADIEMSTLAEINALVAAANGRLDTSRIDPRLLADLPLDVRVVLTWDADNTDIDLYVTDPNGEVCFFGHSATAAGGRMSRDFTGGYGPEEFALRRAVPGKYRIQANFYGNRQQVIAGATTLQVKMFSGFGTRAQKEQMVTLRLKDQGEMVYVGDFDVK